MVKILRAVIFFLYLLVFTGCALDLSLKEIEQESIQLPSVQFSKSYSAVNEQNGDHSVQLTIDPPTTETVSITYSLSGTASETDYREKTLVLTPEQGTGRLDFSILEDLAEEESEFIEVNITSVKIGEGELGDNSTTDRSLPTPINGGHTWSDISAGRVTTCGVTTSGIGYCWGDDDYGQAGIGVGASPDILVPTLVVGSHTWKEIEVNEGESTCGLTTNNQAYCWGSGTDGQLGNGSLNSANAPVLISGGHSWSQLSLGDRHMLGIRQ